MFPSYHPLNRDIRLLHAHRHFPILARTMNFEFLRPVFTGDTIDCRVAIEQCEKTEKDRTAIRVSFECINQHGKPVMIGLFAGVIL